MAYGQTSGTASATMFVSDMVLDAFERCGIYALEAKHLFSARRSLLLLTASSWNNRSVNLWKVDGSPTRIPLVAGVPTFGLTSDCVLMLDTFRRTYSLGSPTNAGPNFSTVNGSPIVTAVLPAGSTLKVGNYFQIVVNVSVGGLNLYGFYQVVSTPAPNQITFNAGQNASATVNNGGAVATLNTTNGSTSVRVNLAAHGYLAGQSFVVPVATNVGGLTLFGSYTIQTITDLNNFTIQAPSNANANAAAQINGGQTQIAAQVQGQAGFTDIFMTPFSRTDYASQANKLATGPPTNYWFEKLSIPEVTVWPVADQFGPYEMQAYFMRQIQDAVPSGGQVADVPPRMLKPFVDELAKDLSMKWAIDRYDRLAAAAAASWEEASGSDTEIASTYIVPQVPSGL